MNMIRNLTVECISVKLGTGVTYDERISPIGFSGSEVISNVVLPQKGRARYLTKYCCTSS